MSEQREWERNLFEALASQRVSRNRHFAEFAGGWFRAVHRRWRTMRAVRRDAERLAGVEDSTCEVSDHGEDLLVRLRSPRLAYSREVVVRPHEWEWLVRHEAVQVLLKAAPHRALAASR